LCTYKSNQAILGNLGQISRTDLLELVSNQIRINAKILLLTQKQPAVISLIHEMLKVDSKSSCQFPPRVESTNYKSNLAPVNFGAIHQSGLTVYPSVLSLNSSMGHTAPKPPNFQIETLPSVRDMSSPDIPLVCNSSCQFYLRTSLKFHQDSTCAPGKIFYPHPVRNMTGPLYENPMSKSVHLVRLPANFPPQTFESGMNLPPRYQHLARYPPNSIG